MQDEFSKNTGQTCPDGMMCEHFALATKHGSQAKAALMSFVPGSPASRSATTAKKRLKTMSGGCGPKSPVSFGFYDHNGSCWRTYQGCLNGELEVFSATFPPSGMTRNGTLYRLPRSVPHIFVDESLWFPTPQARDHKGKSQRAEYGDEGCMPNVIGGPPNPHWLAWVMGFPSGWLEQLPVETLSSPK
jgi:hypothetical protein